jgi:riboflavin kinase/FMN adenylyltransferase
MKLIRHLPATHDRPTAVAIGNFDGVHRGHRAVIGAMQEAAKAETLVPSVLTFEPHPRRFFTKDSAPFRIVRLRDKLAQLQQTLVERVYAPRFDANFAGMSAEDFLDIVLGQQLGAKIVVTGENFAFGNKRRGDSTMLKNWGNAHGVHIITVPPVTMDGEICSSSAIRKAIGAGAVKHAAALLGRPYRMSGRVVHGQARGRTIGFPTANVALTADLIAPSYGVYAVRATVDGTTFDGVANFGIRPTVSVDNQPTLEVYLFDTVQEIYGKMLHVDFVDKLRGEMKFAGIDALKEQIANDCAAARLALAGSA